MKALLFHGGNLKAAQAFFTDAPPNWLDLSTGISPWSYWGNYEKVWDYSCLKTLPQAADIKALEGIAAKYFGANPDEIIAVPGSDIAIRILGRILGAENINLINPIFSGHIQAFPRTKSVNPDDLPKLRGEYVVFANPNNPDGRLLKPDFIAQSGIKFIADEAFMDLTPENSMVKRRRDGIILRSFGKFFGLAGLRLGFVIADRDIIAEIAQYMGDWAISSLAVQIASAAYQDSEWQQNQRTKILEMSQKMQDLLVGFGAEIICNSGLFITIKTLGARGLFTHMGRSAILTRPFDYAPEWLRFGLCANASELVRLEQTLEIWRKSHE